MIKYIYFSQEKHDHLELTNFTHEHRLSWLMKVLIIVVAGLIFLANRQCSFFIRQQCPIIYSKRINRLLENYIQQGISKDRLLSNHLSLLITKY